MARTCTLAAPPPHLPSWQVPQGLPGPAGQTHYQVHSADACTEDAPATVFSPCIKHSTSTLRRGCLPPTLRATPNTPRHQKQHIFAPASSHCITAHPSTGARLAGRGLARHCRPCTALLGITEGRARSNQVTRIMGGSAGERRGHEFDFGHEE